MCSLESQDIFEIREIGSFVIYLKDWCHLNPNRHLLTMKWIKRLTRYSTISCTWKITYSKKGITSLMITIWPFQGKPMLRVTQRNLSMHGISTSERLYWNLMIEPGLEGSYKALLNTSKSTFKVKYFFMKEKKSNIISSQEDRLKKVEPDTMQEV